MASGKIPELAAGEDLNSRIQGLADFGRYLD
jgi:hypothetical protein